MYLLAFYLILYCIFSQYLPNLVASYEVPFPKWNHLDFIWAIDADILLYPEILKNMEEMRKTVPEWNTD